MDLSEILTCCTVDEFLLEHFGAHVIHAPGRHGRFAQLLPSPVPKEWKTGTDRIDRLHEPLNLTAQSLEHSLEAPVRVTLNTAAIAARREPHDLLILQAAGQAQHRIHGNEDKPSAEPTQENLLNDGDALYVPAGSWHSADSSGDPLQLIIAIDNPTGADLFAWLTDLIKDEIRFQSPIPRFATPAARADYLTGLRRAFARVFRAPDLLERHRRFQNNSASPRSVDGVPWTPTLSGAHMITLAPRSLRIRRAGPDTIFLVCLHKRFPFPEDAAPLLHFLRDHAPATIADFYTAFEGDFEREELDDFLSTLSRNHIIVIREPHG